MDFAIVFKVAHLTFALYASVIFTHYEHNAFGAIGTFLNQWSVYKAHNNPLITITQKFLTIRKANRHVQQLIFSVF